MHSISRPMGAGYSHEWLQGGRARKAADVLLAGARCGAGSPLRRHGLLHLLLLLSLHVKGVPEGFTGPNGMAGGIRSPLRDPFKGWVRPRQCRGGDLT